MRTFLILVLALISIESFGQNDEENILYVIDSIPLINDPTEEDGELIETDIESITVITDQLEIEQFGYENLDKIIFIYTKEYIKRPLEIKTIPSTKQMKRINGKWHLDNSTTPYSGKFIDYYLNGKLQGEGVFKDGLVEGLRTVYYQDGTKQYYRNYSQGFENGDSKEYYPNGKIHQEGIYINGKEDGLWKEWHSSGKLKREILFSNGVAKPSKEQEKFYKLMSSGTKVSAEGNYKSAIKSFDKAIEINPDYSDLYFHRGTAFFMQFKFDEAIEDYNKALDLEPLYKEALSNRAFARLRKYEFANSRTLSKSEEVTIMASKDKVDIPTDELEKICIDLSKGYELGDKSAMIEDYIERYCK